MQLEIRYNTPDGLKKVSFYQTFFRNKDLRVGLMDRFFNDKNRQENLEKIRTRFIEYSEEEQVPEKQKKDFLENYLSDAEGIDKALCISLLSINHNMAIVQFMANIFHNLIDRYFDSDAIRVALFLNAQSKEDFSYLIVKDELPKWIELLERYQYVELCPPLAYYAWREHLPFPLKALVDAYKNGEVKDSIVIQSEYFEWDEFIDEDEIEDDFADLTPFERLECAVVSEGSMISLEEVLSLQIFEHELVASLKAV